MGNCFTHENSYWADEDWGSLVSTHGWHRYDDEINNTEEKVKLLGHGEKIAGNTSEVKLTISKKELEQLVHMMDVQGSTLEQALARMLVDGGGDVYEVEQRRPWKPVLQSIPE
ncbi:hypothetical protein Gohar_025858, partial [Gossypium harknessii]|nr:hypothetical protein [Gossypium harknessii]